MGKQKWVLFVCAMFAFASFSVSADTSSGSTCYTYGAAYSVDYKYDRDEFFYSEVTSYRNPFSKCPSRQSEQADANRQYIETAWNLFFKQREKFFFDYSKTRTASACTCDDEDPADVKARVQESLNEFISSRDGELGEVVPGFSVDDIEWIPTSEIEK